MDPSLGPATDRRGRLRLSQGETPAPDPPWGPCRWVALSGRRLSAPSPLPGARPASAHSVPTEGQVVAVPSLQMRKLRHRGLHKVLRAGHGQVSLG